MNKLTIVANIIAKENKVELVKAELLKLEVRKVRGAENMTNYTVGSNEKGNFLKAMMMVVLGLMLASVGQDTLSDIPRFTFDNMNLSDGISFVLVVMATFAMSEALTIIFKANDPTKAAKQISLSQLGSIKLDKDETK